jgi:hypothetical protein
MNNFRTSIRIGRSNYSITLKNPVLTAGSCFSEAIGNRLAQYKFDTCSNPFGVIYNPVSIHTSLMHGFINQPAADHSYLVNQNVHLNYDFHSAFSSLEKAALVTQLNDTIGLVHDFSKRVTHVLITYGTAWVYCRKDTGEIVANCHKVPQHQFDKRLLTEANIVDSFKNFHKLLKTINPNVRVIVTVSPVRHLKDSLELNSVSKAILRSSCHTLVSQFEAVEYFPAYEIMMDDLRDYRFYKSDMLHPTEDAEKYIWSKFCERYMNEETKNFITYFDSILSALRHKPFHSASPAHQLFLKETLTKLEALKDEVNVNEEIAYIKTQII